MEGKKLKVVSVVVIVLIIAVAAVWYFAIKRPYDIAVQGYESAVQIVENKNAELDTAVNELQALIDSGDEPLENDILTAAKEVIKTAGTNKVIVGDMPKKTADILSRTEELSQPVDYTEDITKLNESYTSLDNSIKQMNQLMNPSEDFVMQRLQSIDDILNVKAVTEDNDPNGKLNKAGGYTATLYFESKNVDQSQFYESDVIAKGTAAGGAVEVYASVEDAENRNTYLASFDGGIFASGSHRVAGTVVIRTSDELTATQQKDLEAKIYDALTTLQ